MARMLNQVAMKDGGGSVSSSSNNRTTNQKPSLVYNSKTGKWEPATPNTSTTTTQTTTTPTPPKQSDTSTSGSTTYNTNSHKDSDKKYIEAEFNILNGELQITSTEKSIRIKVNDTVKVEGIGKYLSGLYFVSAVKRTLTQDGGYSHTLSLIKNGFGSNVKKSPPVVIAKKEEPPTVAPRAPEVPKPAPEYKVGDIVKIVGDNATYSNAHDGVKVPAWVKKKNHTIRQISSDKTRVLLKEIFSWTYVKYIQKV